jgi:hypothetical protein
MTQQQILMLGTELEGLENAARTILERVQFLQNNVKAITENRELREMQLECAKDWIYSAGQWVKSVELTLRDCK